MPVLPSGHGSHVYPAHVSRVPGPDGHAARDTCPSDTAAKLSLSRYSDLGQQSYARGQRMGAEVSGVRRKTEMNMNILDESRVCQKLWPTSWRRRGKTLTSFYEQRPVPIVCLLSQTIVRVLALTLRQWDRMTALRPWPCSLDPSLHSALHAGPLHGKAQGGHRDAALWPGDSADDSRHQHQVSLGLRLRPRPFRGKYKQGHEVIGSNFGYMEVLESWSLLVWGLYLDKSVY